ncbi:MAG TPA: amidohydrolase family protein [Cellvibrionaceae bacterium]|nr:amidohydrolase family protein [Cellvibrionaceae bacterium]
MHIIDKRFALMANEGFLPAEFTCADYRAAMASYPLVGGAVVSGSFQGVDQDYLIAALQELGPGFVGITQLPADAPDKQIMALHQAGVRAVRFNVRRGGSADINDLTSMAQRIFDLAGWHVELYVDSSMLADMYASLIKLPAVSIDHMGLSKSGLPFLLRLVERGVRVKACGFGRVDFAVAPVLKDLYKANPHGLMFGSDLPSTRAPRPYQVEDFNLVVEALGEDAARKVLSENGQMFYKRLKK